MKEDERRAAVSRLSGAAKEALKEWKEKTGIRTVLAKTKNQKLEMRRERTRARIMAKHRKESHGAASEVRVIVKREITQDDFPVRKISKRRMMPKLPKMSKAELREMLSQIVKETAKR